MTAAFDVLTAPLRGTALVEANAGTGKTWAVASLFVRLVIETGLSVDRILVVTYTEAATAELRDRVRGRLRGMRDALTQGASDDVFFAELLRRTPDPVVARRRLERALQSFDEAAIFTIHGFCQRVLAESAFENAVPFELELITDDYEIRQDVVHDFWRAENHDASPQWAAELARLGGPDPLCERLSPVFGRPFQEKLAPPLLDTESAEQEVAAAAAEVRKAWQTRAGELTALLRDAPGLNRNQYRLTSMDAGFDGISRWCDEGSRLLPLPKYLPKLGAARIAAATKKKFQPLEDPFFEAVQRLTDAAEQLERAYATRRADLYARLIEFADVELPERKRERRVRFFDDLLLELHGALSGPGGDKAAEAIRCNYGAALIDEFQDTDPLQYEIFHRLFAGQDQPLFFVGDPKQAIYAFRGADVFAYLRARDDAANRHTLARNYRSVPGLVTAVNRLFASARPFFLESIGYEPSQPAADVGELCVDGQKQVPMTLWFAPGEGDKPAPARSARPDIAEVVATSVVDLLNLAAGGRAHIGERALDARDIAILVRTHDQARIVYEALARRGVVAVRYSEENVFATAEAMEMERLVAAVIEPHREQLVRGALLTDILGYDAARIEDLARDDRAWQLELERFHHYRKLWQRHGFARMYRTLLSEHDVFERLLAFSDGERRLTNLLHLEELLQQEALRRGGRLEEIAGWIAAQRVVTKARDEALQMRLESDADLVRIVTIHRSKGLDYPVVFCPYLWTGPPGTATDVVSFHDPASDHAARLDLGTKDFATHAGIAADEDLSERLRLAYVALTRAKSACFLVVGNVRGYELSAPGWLLHQQATPVADYRAHVSRVTALGAQGLRQELEQFAQPEVVQILDLPAASDGRYVGRAVTTRELQARPLTRELPRGWRVSSFSALALKHPERPRDYDGAAAENVPRDDTVAEGIFAFPRGARAGRCLHAVFENLDFSLSAGDIEMVARARLDEHGFADHWAPAVAQCVAEVLRTPLGDAPGLRLADVTPMQRRDEMEFYYPADALDANVLRSALGEHGFATPIATRLASVEFRLERGFVHGFIDLVFESDGRHYIVDYKSNWLGNQLDAYAAERLGDAIAAHDYHLQYLLYTVAVHRLLQSRLAGYDYDRHFGGVFYLFLRGMRAEHGSRHGVYFDRPTRAVIEALDTALRGVRSA